MANPVHINNYPLFEKGIFDKIEFLIRHDVIKEENGKLYLSQLGYIKFYQLQSKDLKNLAKSINQKRRRKMKIVKRAIIIAIVVAFALLILFIYLF